MIDLDILNLRLVGNVEHCVIGNLRETMEIITVQHRKSDEHIGIHSITHTNRRT